MSTATAFNPLSAAHDMEAIGIDRAHAATLAKLMHLAATANDPVALEKLATKDDLNALKVEIKAEFKDDLNALKAEVKDDLNALRVEGKDDMNALKVEVRSLEARVYRALWIQGVGVVAAVSTIVGILAALRFLPVSS